MNTNWFTTNVYFHATLHDATPRFIAPRVVLYHVAAHRCAPRRSATQRAAPSCDAAFRPAPRRNVLPCQTTSRHATRRFILFISRAPFCDAAFCSAPCRSATHRATPLRRFTHHRTTYRNVGHGFSAYRNATVYLFISLALHHVTTCCFSARHTATRHNATQRFICWFPPRRIFLRRAAGRHRTSYLRAPRHVTTLRIAPPHVAPRRIATSHRSTQPCATQRNDFVYWFSLHRAVALLRSAQLGSALCPAIHRNDFVYWFPSPRIPSHRASARRFVTRHGATLRTISQHFVPHCNVPLFSATLLAAPFHNTACHHASRFRARPRCSSQRYATICLLVSHAPRCCTPYRIAWPRFALLRAVSPHFAPQLSSMLRNDLFVHFSTPRHVLLGFAARRDFSPRTASQRYMSLCRASCREFAAPLRHTALLCIPQLFAARLCSTQRNDVFVHFQRHTAYCSTTQLSVQPRIMSLRGVPQCNLPQLSAPQRFICLFPRHSACRNVSRHTSGRHGALSRNATVYLLVSDATPRLTPLCVMTRHDVPQHDVGHHSVARHYIAPRVSARHIATQRNDLFVPSQRPSVPRSAPCLNVSRYALWPRHATPRKNPKKNFGKNFGTN